VAVISPAEAAGLADFRALAGRLAGAGLCEFDYHAALFQGRETEASIVEAFRRIHADNEACLATTGYDRYDAVAIIRGGGARGDLDWLNTYRVVRWAARFPLPVWVGIGHQTDSVLLDEVAHQAFDTPSKVIHGIADRIVARARRAQQNIDTVARQVQLRTRGALARVETQWVGAERGARHVVERAASSTHRASDAIHSSARARVIESGMQVERQFGELALRARQIPQTAGGAIARESNALQRLANQRAGDARRAFVGQGQLLAGSASAALGRLSRVVDTCAREVSRAASEKIAQAAEGLGRESVQLDEVPRTRVAALQGAVDLWIRQIVLLGPEKTLGRGFAIVRDESGTPVVRGNAIAPGVRLSLEFQDGKINARRENP
jgi:exodeoxyribonuclease VII large subunit